MIRLIVIAIIFCLTPKLHSQQVNWSTYADPDSLFIVDCPYSFSEKKKPVLTGIESIPVYTYYAKTDEETANFLYLINIADYPEGTFPADSLALKEAFLDESIQSLALNLRGKIDYTTPITQPTEGYKVRISQQDKSVVVKALVFLFDDRFYTLQVFTHQNTSLNRDVDRFFESFKLMQ